MSYYQIRNYIKKQFSGVSVAKFFINSFQIVLNIIISFLLSKIIIEATKGNVSGVIIIAAVILSIKFFEFSFNSTSGIIIGKKESLKTHKCKMAFYRAFFDKPLKDLYSLQIGETKERINDDFNTVTQKYATVFPHFVTFLVSVIAYLSYLMILDIWVAVTLLTISALQIIPPLIIKRFLQVNYDNCRKIEARITDFIVEGYRGFLTIKLFKLKKWWQHKLSKYHKEYSKVGRASIYTGTAEGVLDDIISKILTYGTYGIIGLYVLNNITSLDIGIQAIALSASLFGVVKASFSIIKDLAVSRTAEKRLEEELSTVIESNEHINSGDIVIADLSYSYDDNTIFSGLNISFDKTIITIIKGKNGGGKTTLLRLIAGIIENDGGIISIDGFSPVSLSSNNYPKKIFYLPQDDPTFYFSANELFSMILLDRDKIATDIAKRFGLNDKSVYDSKISELSGGERKKVFLSLGFAINPTIMMLDEPTNSLDEKGKTVLKELLKLRNGGAIIVTHDCGLDDISDAIVEVNGENNKKKSCY